MSDRAITPRVHGVLDYTTATVLLAAPKMLGLQGTPAGAVLRAAGAGTVGYSLLTAYELGAVKLLPYRAHLAIDAVSACGLLAAPWIAGRARRRSRWPFGARRSTRSQWLPHAAFGAWELAAVALSVPGARAGSQSPPPEVTLPTTGADAGTAAAGGGSGSGTSPADGPDPGGLQR